MASLKERIIDALRSQKLVTAEQLEEVLAVQRKRGGSLQQLLMDRKLVSETDLLMAVSQGIGIPPVTLSKMRLDPNLKSLVSRAMALQYQLIPVSCMGQTLTVAMVDPLNVFAMDTIGTMTGLSINPLLAGAKDLRDAIDQYYGTGVEESLRQIMQKTESDSMEITTQSASRGSGPTTCRRRDLIPASAWGGTASRKPRSSGSGHPRSQVPQRPPPSCNPYC